MTRLLLLSLILFPASQIVGGQEKPFFSYKHQGRPYKELSLTIENSGQAHVQIEKSARSNYDTQLGKEELETLHSLIRATDFFSQPDKDSSFVTDTGLTDITVNDADRARTLTFSYRPTLQPLSDFIWKLFSQAEAWEALRRGDVYEVMGALVEDYAAGKALQPYVFKRPLMEYLRSARDNRKIECGLRALATVTTPEEFAGFVASQIRPGDTTSPLLRYSADRPKAHQLALCPLYLTYLKEHYPKPDDHNRGDNISQFLSDRLGDLRYEPSIPYFLQLLDAQNEPALKTPLITLAKIGLPCLRELAARLESGHGTRQLNAMRVMTLAFRSNSKNPVPNPFPDYEFDEMRKVFEAVLLPKLSQVSEKDPVEAVRNEAARSIDQIKTEITKKDEIVGPFVKLSEMPDHRLKRTKLEGEEHMTICWHVIIDGKPTVQSFSQGETEYTSPYHTPGVYTAYVSAWVQGEYRVVSNVVSYKITANSPSPPNAAK